MHDKPIVKAPKKYQKRLKIEGDYTMAIANDVAKLAKHLRIPQKVLRGWFITEFGHCLGWLSSPVTREHYAILLIIANHLWGNEKLIRIQLGEKAQSRRDHILRGSGLTWIEQVVLEDVLRRKCLGQRRYLTWAHYISCLRGRYPEGYRQLDGPTFTKMKKKACDLLRYAKNNGQYERLLVSLGLEMVDGKVMPKAMSRQVKLHKQLPPGHASKNATQSNQSGQRFIDPLQVAAETYAQMRESVKRMLTSGNEELANLFIPAKHKGDGLIDDLKKELAAGQAQEEKKRRIDDAAVIAWYMAEADQSRQSHDGDQIQGAPPDPDGKR